MPTVKKQFMFLHIPKTAGTTFVLTLTRHFNGKKKLAQYYYTSFNNFPKHTPEYLNRYDLSYGHVPLNTDLKVERGIDYFTFLRNPRDRILSSYKYVKGDGEHVIKERINIKDYSLKDFLKQTRLKNFDNLMVRYLSGNFDKEYMTVNDDDLQLAIKNLDTHFSVFGLTEYFDESLVLLAHHLGWSPLFYLKENSSSYKIDAKELDEETERLILACNKYDEVLYQHALSRFKKMMADKKEILENGLKELREGSEKRRFVLSIRNKGSLLLTGLMRKFK